MKYQIDIDLLISNNQWINTSNFYCKKKVININWHTRPSPPTQPIENHLRYGCSRCVCVGSHYKSNQRLICVAAESWFLSSQYEKDLKFIFFGNFPLHPAPSTHWGNFLFLFLSAGFNTLDPPPKVLKPTVASIFWNLSIKKWLDMTSTIYYHY